MTQLTGQGDASSIPPDLKFAVAFCAFLSGLRTTIEPAEESLVSLAHEVEYGTDKSVEEAHSEPPRDSAIAVVTDLIESQLMKDRVKGSRFKGNQVRYPAVILDTALLRSCKI